MNKLQNLCRYIKKTNKMYKILSITDIQKNEILTVNNRLNY